MRIKCFGLLIVVLFTCGLATAQTEPTESKFLRFVDDGHGGGQLEASVVRYRNSNGVTVDLIAAVHVADPSFYRQLDRSFRRYDSLLYELVKPRDMVDAATQPSTYPLTVSQATTQPTTARQTNHAHPSYAWVGMMQRFMRDKLELSFQLEAIDYSAPNFINADLDAETFFDLQEQRGESMLSIMINEMIHQMANPDQGPKMSIFDILFALQQPDSARVLKLLLARQFAEIDDLAAGLGDPDSSVIIGERNKAALNVLKQRIAAGDKRIGIFYGAAHLKSMEHTLTAQMGFKQVGAPRWRTAWDVRMPTTKPTTQALPVPN